ncbi:unnamed protein product [Owenia fusiformis]|uniref:Uncharacterized protein n=1 Tax=Owenia fusiformis TaxID=6347 RepID=A0A8J1UCQ2_OWEFU|nr:unnamed protein product [Owenia fusiformis]
MIYAITLFVCCIVFANAGPVDDPKPVLFDEDMNTSDPPEAVLFNGETTPLTPTLHDDETKCYYKLFREKVENDDCLKYETFPDGWRGEYMGNKKQAHTNQLRRIIEKQSQNIEILLNKSSNNDVMGKGNDIRSLVKLQTQLANLIFEAKNQTSIHSLKKEMRETAQALSVEIKNLELDFENKIEKMYESVKAVDDTFQRDMTTIQENFNAIIEQNENDNKDKINMLNTQVMSGWADREELRNQTYQTLSDLLEFKRQINGLQEKLNNQGSLTQDNRKLIKSLQQRTNQIETIIQAEGEQLKERLMNVEDTNEKQQDLIEQLIQQKHEDDTRDEQQTARMDNLEHRLMGEVASAKDQSAKSEHVLMLERKLNAKDNELVQMKRDLDAIRGILANIGQPLIRQPTYINCQDALQYYESISGIYSLRPDTRAPFPAYCDMEGSDGWVVIQRRQDGNVDFYRNWEDYKNGFGDLLADHYLGNKHIHILTNVYDSKLKIELYDWEDNMRYAEYDSFKIGSEDENYKLHASGYHGNAGDALSYHNEMEFSTRDRRNDLNDGLCVEWGHGAWWYNNCYNSNLNGRYYYGGPYSTNSFWGDGVVWRNIRDTNFYSLKKVVMKIKQK